MLTNSDIQKLKTIFATKEDLLNYATKHDLYSLEERLLEKLATKEDFREYMTKVENIFGKVEKMMNEFHAHAQQHSDINDRLNRIEKVPVIAHVIKNKD